MCLRPDITYVVPPLVYLEYLRLTDAGMRGDSSGFHRYCETQIHAAQQARDQRSEQHWHAVRDFGMRTTCSPLSGVEVEGYRVNEVYYEVNAADTIRLYIGNPNNPEHVPGQAEITAERMAEVNGDYLAASLG